MAENFSSMNVSIRRTDFWSSGVFSNVTFHASSSPRRRESACGIVPMGFSPISFAPSIPETPSAPPMNAALSIIGEIDGCILLIPNEKNGRLPAAILILEDFVDIPED